ncbi:MAG TPA: glycosyltransferase family 4 protein [Candidatus Acidoferrales bacterium]|nr:glycosyltransferase family 4 protein [Candidatus Acidoferrales bacterium]
MSRTRERRLRFFLVGTEFFRSYGGIQYVNRLLVRALCEMGLRTPLDLEVFSYIDGPEHFPAEMPGARAVRWFGAERRRGELAWQLTRRLTAARPDLVLFTHVSLAPLGELVRRLAPGARVAVLAHGTEVWSPLEARVARFLPRIDSFVSPSAFTAQKLADLHAIPGEKITVIPHGLDPDWMLDAGNAPEKRPASNGDSGSALLSVTRLSRADREGKGIDLVLQALPSLLDRYPGIRYRIVGGGGDLPRLAGIVSKLGMDSRVELAGARREDALKQAYSEADIFVLPTQVEGFGIVFLEAMYNRLPVVAACASAVPEVVEDGVTGLLAAPGNVGELSAALASLLADSELRGSMGEAGRSRVERLYSFERFAARWERWMAAQVPEVLYAARQTAAFTRAQAAAGAA